MNASWITVIYGVGVFLLLFLVTLTAGSWGAIRRVFREPVLRYPILIIESDDWSPGPESHALALETIESCLREFRDRRGRHPVMTLGLILTSPDGKAICEAKGRTFHSVSFDDTRSAALARAIWRGIDHGVFAAQLHGMEHFWPGTLQGMLAGDSSLLDWICSFEFPQTEALPSHLQSRWTDASRLPSRELPAEAVNAAFQQEAAEFTRIFGSPPAVYVPTTFVWGDSVEKAASIAGVRVFVTPGFRSTGRNELGQPQRDTRRYSNGEVLSRHLVTVIRDIYFEPGEGHRASDTLIKVVEHAQCGRPALLETHRINFTGDADTRARSISELAELLRTVQRRLPETCFMSTEELGELYCSSNSLWIERRPLPRLRAWLHRLISLPRIGKVLRLLGVVSLLRWLEHCGTGEAGLRSA